MRPFESRSDWPGGTPRLPEHADDACTGEGRLGGLVAGAIEAHHQP